MRCTPDTLTALLGACAVTLTAGCAGGASQASATLPAMGANREPGSAAYRGSSWMLPGKKSATLIYAVANDTANVNVYDYANGQQVGAITGFAAAAGCVDAKGDVYIVSGVGNAYEYAHGGTQSIKTYSPGGDLTGCSVDARGDLAITASSPGEIIVYAKGNPTDAKTFSNSTCEVQAALGYDDVGNLIGAGKYDSTYICALLKAARQETTLTPSGITINFPNGSMWDGKYLTIGDEEAGSSKGQTGMYENDALRYDALVGGRGHSRRCLYRGYVDVVNPFVVGKKNTPVNRQQGTVVVGSNLYCAEYDVEGIEFWHYPQGGNPYKKYITGQPVSVLAVSIGG